MCQFTNCMLDLDKATAFSSITALKAGVQGSSENSGAVTSAKLHPVSPINCLIVSFVSNNMGDGSAIDTTSSIGMSCFTVYNHIG